MTQDELVNALLLELERSETLIQHLVARLRQAELYDLDADWSEEAFEQQKRIEQVIEMAHGHEAEWAR